MKCPRRIALNRWFCLSHEEARKITKTMEVHRFHSLPFCGQRFCGSRWQRPVFASLRRGNDGALPSSNQVLMMIARMIDQKWFKADSSPVPETAQTQQSWEPQRKGLRPTRLAYLRLSSTTYKGTKSESTEQAMR